MTDDIRGHIIIGAITPATEGGRLWHDEWHSEGGGGPDKCGTAGCGFLGRILAVEAEARDPLASALLEWFDTTHGNEFGHDHHCPAPWNDQPYTQPIFDGCTCGWSDVQRADQARSARALGLE